MQNQDLEKDQEMTEKYMAGEDEIADNAREMNPNRNTDKKKATNAGGYRQ